MIYKKVKFVKKQISHDRGVTWQDTEPLEYCEPEVVGIYPSMQACMDTDCELEKYEYELIDTNIEDFPKLCTEVEFTDCCHSGTSYEKTVTYHFPSGIIKHVKFSDYYGHITPSSIGTLHDVIYKAYDDISMDMESVVIGTYHDGFSISGASGASIDGREVIFEGSTDCFCGGDAVWRCWMATYCFTVDELMPWVGDSIKIIWKKHYIREHCSEEWQLDEDFGAQFLGVAEEWIKTYDASMMAFKWEQRVANVDSAGTITWVNGSEPPYYEEQLAVPNGSIGKNYIDTTDAYPVSINIANDKERGNVDIFRIEFGAKSLSTYNALLGTFSEYHSYDGEHDTYKIKSSNKNNSLYVEDTAFSLNVPHYEIEIKSTATHYNYIRSIYLSNGELMIGGYIRALPQYGAVITLSESDNIKVYIVYYRDINNVVHILIPVRYNGNDVWIDTTARKIIKPITTSGTYYSEGDWYESF